MRALRNRHSWPPLRKPRSFQVDEKIDEDPFAYFISPAEDRDEFSETDLAAGIRDDRWKSRSLSPVYPGRQRRFRKAWSQVADSPTLTLKRWIERMEKQYFHRRPSSHTLPRPGPLGSPSPPTSPPLRGRRNYRAGAIQRVAPVVRSPPRRPRSWREPSVDIWPVLEELEDSS